MCYARVQPGPLASPVTGGLHAVQRCSSYISGVPRGHSVTAPGTQKQRAHIYLIPTIMLHGSVAACINHGSHMRDTMFQQSGPQTQNRVKCNKM